MVADGPRTSRPGDEEKCAAARAIIDSVDWDCDVQRNFSETNMGCSLRISSGINWAFEFVDKAIILEDDCVPSVSFVPYCAELLDRYASDERVMMVSGNNFLFGDATPADSYYFSRYPHVWGWATWRRAWEKYDHDMTRWPEIRDRKLFHQYFPKVIERCYWESVFQHVYQGSIDSWGYRWVYSVWVNSGLSVAPARNLIRNIGFGADATHTKWDSVYSSLVSQGAEELDLPLTHPATVLASFDNDDLEFRIRAARTKGVLTTVNQYASVLKVLSGRATARGQWPDPGLLLRGA
ncbi:methyltransferase type 11 [Mycobacterium europaeum]|nr:methyltransferase type 11 [Mycobacterium europaeum]